MPRIFLVRHGETLWNKESRYQGQLDIPLSDVGRIQALKLAKRFSRENISAIFSSDLSRAYETARIINIFHNKTIIKTPNLRELCFGKWEGKTYEELVGEVGDEYINWLKNPFYLKPPEGESLADLISRITSVFYDILKTYNEDENIILVTHGGPIKAFISAILEINTAVFFKLKIGNASVTEIFADGFGELKDIAYIVKINDTCHLK
ncbi:MAG: histidine phosphatase family protein [Thermovenabulum sp.]|uniref:histidine phosphatase family protein n=1 Tax=Thermovenabulum sp. TaxID=3100335 RepID=UPI003C7C1249